MNTAGIIFLSLGILVIIISVICTIVARDSSNLLFSAFSLIFFFLFDIFNWPEPGTQDVKNEKAIYVEEKNVGINQNGDTIYNYNTYHIEWLPEWKYGRKQNYEN